MKNRSQIAFPARCIGAVAGVFLMTSAHAASFDCHKASSFSEKAVCGDVTLSALDDTLAERYARAYSVAQDKHAIAAVRDQEWHWRQTHCQDKECVSDWYQRRIAELNADIGSNGNVVAALASPATDRAQHVEQSATPAQAIAGAGLAHSVVSGAERPAEPMHRTASVAGLPAEPMHRTASVASIPAQTVGSSPATVEKVNLTPPSTGPLPPDFAEAARGATRMAADTPATATESAGMLPLPAKTWPASVSPSMLSQTAKTQETGGYRLFNQGERASARTVGIFVGF